MPLLSLLSPADQRKFDSPISFQQDERQIFLTVNPEVRRLLRGISKPSNQIGLILQLGHFLATAKFFTVSRFRPRDIDFVRQQLGLATVDLSDYNGTVVILQHWNDILRFMATIKSHHTTASQLFSV